MTSIIELKGLKFFSYHGLYDYERKNGGWFKVDVIFNCDASNAIDNDSIEGTVNYEEIYKIVRNEMEVPSRLVEHVAGRIHKKITEDVPGVLQLLVTVYKLEAPLGGPLDHVSITVQ